MGIGMLLVENRFLIIRFFSMDLVKIDNIQLFIHSTKIGHSLSKSMEVINYILNVIPEICLKLEKKESLKVLF